jgi:hypothetical protein
MAIHLNDPIMQREDPIKLLDLMTKTIASNPRTCAPPALPPAQFRCADAHRRHHGQGSLLPRVWDGMSTSPSASAATKPRGNAPDVPHQARMLEDHRHRQHSAARALMALASTKPVNAETEEQRKPANAETEEQRKPAKRKMRTGGGGLNGSVLFRSHQKHKLITKNNLTLEQCVKCIGSTKVARNDVRKSIRSLLPDEVQGKIGAKEHGRKLIHSHLLDMWRQLSHEEKCEYNRCARKMRRVLEHSHAGRGRGCCK